MKKIIFTLFGLALPAASALACSANLSQLDIPLDDWVGDKNPAIKSNSKLNIERISKLPTFQVDGQDYPVKDDGLYLVKDAYQGIFWSGDQTNGTQVDAKVVPLKTAKPYHVGVSLLSGGDSFYVLYNDNDQDGYSIANFLDSFYLHDTNLITNQESFELNRESAQAVKLGHRWGHYTGIPFVQKTDLTGQTPRYYGEQSKLPAGQSWDASFAEFLQKETSPAAVNLAANFWNVKTTPNKSGSFDPQDPSASGASKLWLPITGQENYFSYQITHRNAVKITFNQTANKPYIDAQFGLAKDGSLDFANREISAQDVKIYSVIVGGKDRHNDYLNHQNQVYQYRALKERPVSNSRLHKLGDEYLTFHAKDASWLGQKLANNLHFNAFRLNGVDGKNYVVHRSGLPSSHYQVVFDLHVSWPEEKRYRLVSTDGKKYQLMLKVDQTYQPVQNFNLVEIVKRVVT
ncbi:hypothetical protein [Mycoplasma sp. ATU-Cv-508]|uniref:hypothetical protein n=1 Tax=Mycoplasma sp. ATU-Cv-508 TaxID=2048001 RepID=UPI000FDD5A7F